MARQLRRLVVGLVLGTLVGWFWLRRQEREAALDAPRPAAPETEDRIVLPAWSQPTSMPEASPVSGRIVLPNGKDATSTMSVPPEVATVETPSPAAGVEEAPPVVEVAPADVPVSPVAAPAESETPSGEAVAEPVVETPASVTAIPEGYCVRCKEQRPMVNVRQYMTANKRPALKGECAVCGAGMSKFIKE